MDPSAEPSLAPSPLAVAQRQYASLQTSLGWLLGFAEPYSALVPPAGANLATRLRRAAPTLAWNNAGQERLVAFADTLAAIEVEAEHTLAAGGGDPGLAARIERASAEALAFYMAIQSEGRSAAELSRTTAAEDDSPTRLRARAEIGAGVRERLDSVGAEKLPAVGLELYRMRGFVDSASCGQLIGLIERDLFPSAVLGKEGNPGFRTSKSCNLSQADPPVAEFEAKVAALLAINPRFGEGVQGQRYEVGQQFKPHHDFFHKAASYYEDVAQTGGQRTWTAMLFLSRPDEGGYTNFPSAAVRAAPEPGTLLTWNNMAADGSPNPRSLHQGMPVEAGMKYVLTKWFRERPLIF